MHRIRGGIEEMCAPLNVRRGFGYVSGERGKHVGRCILVIQESDTSYTTRIWGGRFGNGYTFGVPCNDAVRETKFWIKFTSRVECGPLGREVLVGKSARTRIHQKYALRALMGSLLLWLGIYLYYRVADMFTCLDEVELLRSAMH